MKMSIKLAECVGVTDQDVFILSTAEPRHWVGKPAYLVPVPSQDKVEGL